jgi:hypothetical protein
MNLLVGVMCASASRASQQNELKDLLTRAQVWKGGGVGGWGCSEGAARGGGLSSRRQKKCSQPSAAPSLPLDSTLAPYPPPPPPPHPQVLDELDSTLPRCIERLIPQNYPAFVVRPCRGRRGQETLSGQGKHCAPRCGLPLPPSDAPLALLVTPPSPAHHPRLPPWPPARAAARPQVL